MSNVFTIDQMVALEKAAFAEGADAWELMQNAGQQMAEAIFQKIQGPGTCRVYAGKGNNAGDAFVVARRLRETGWQVEVICPFLLVEMSPLAQKAAAEFEKTLAESSPFFRFARQSLVVVDGLLGIGARGEVRAPLLEMIRAINSEREKGACVFALDLPSGLGSGSETVVADHTLTVGFAKDVLLVDAAIDFVGRISVLPLAPLSARAPKTTSSTVATAAGLRHLLPPRPFDQHKGMSGRVAVVAGSLGTAGAAVLAATGALRAGAGLVSLYCPPEIYPSLAPMLPPEVMAQPWENAADIVSEKLDALAIGPGLDPRWAGEILPLVAAALHARVPMILDAGALTMLARVPSLLGKCDSAVLLTPHPGEMERLFAQNGRCRADWARDFIGENRAATLLLKGARTIVAARDRPLSYNSTGHPGMATGGMGDTLTGVCAALLGQKLSPYDTARLGAWVCGRAAEIALIEDGQSQESLLPTDLDACLGRAFSDLRAGIY